jgi:diadenosine tetraphosphate (Ap4A) HIT family hydrolase
VEINTKEFVVFNDGFPVTEGHMLIVPKVSDQETITKCFKFAISMGNDNVVSDKTTITGFNIGLNIGKSAGQTVMYPHVHLIFRRDGDCPDPVGGVRNVIPGKGNYRKGI